MGRPTLYNPDRVKAICDALAAGNPRWVAAVAGGISHETFNVWSKQKPAFSEAIKEAEAEAVRRNLAIIQKAAKRNWTAAAWWLERRYREDFGRQLDIRIERERIIEDTRKLAIERGIDPDVAIIEVEALLLGTSPR